MKIIEIALIINVIFLIACLFILYNLLAEKIAIQEEIKLIEFKSELRSMNVGDTKEFPASQYMAKMAEVFQVEFELNRSYSAETERRVFRRVLIIKRTR